MNVIITCTAFYHCYRSPPRHFLASALGANKNPSAERFQRLQRPPAALPPLRPRLIPPIRTLNTLALVKWMLQLNFIYIGVPCQISQYSFFNWKSVCPRNAAKHISSRQLSEKASGREKTNGCKWLEKQKTIKIVDEQSVQVFESSAIRESERNSPRVRFMHFSPSQMDANME